MGGRAPSRTIPRRSNFIDAFASTSGAAYHFIRIYIVQTNNQLRIHSFPPRLIVRPTRVASRSRSHSHPWKIFLSVCYCLLIHFSRRPRVETLGSGSGSGSEAVRATTHRAAVSFARRRERTCVRRGSTHQVIDRSVGAVQRARCSHGALVATSEHGQPRVVWTLSERQLARGGVSRVALAVSSGDGR